MSWFRIKHVFPFYLNAIINVNFPSFIFWTTYILENYSLPYYTNPWVKSATELFLILSQLTLFIFNISKMYKFCPLHSHTFILFHSSFLLTHISKTTLGKKGICWYVFLISYSDLFSALPLSMILHFFPKGQIYEIQFTYTKIYHLSERLSEFWYSHTYYYSLHFCHFKCQIPFQETYLPQPQSLILSLWFCIFQNIE